MIPESFYTTCPHCNGTRRVKPKDKRRKTDDPCRWCDENGRVLTDDAARLVEFLKDHFAERWHDHTIS